jgi:hypothetical protein
VKAKEKPKGKAGPAKFVDKVKSRAPFVETIRAPNFNTFHMALKPGEKYLDQCKPGERIASVGMDGEEGLAGTVRWVSNISVQVELDAAADSSTGFTKLQHWAGGTIVVPAGPAKKYQRPVREKNNSRNGLQRKRNALQLNEVADKLAEDMLVKMVGRPYKEVILEVRKEHPTWARTDKWMANLAFFMRKDGRLPPLGK